MCSDGLSYVHTQRQIFNTFLRNSSQSELTLHINWEAEGRMEKTNLVPELLVYTTGTLTFGVGLRLPLLLRSSDLITSVTPHRRDQDSTVGVLEMSPFDYYLSHCSLWGPNSLYP